MITFEQILKDNHYVYGQWFEYKGIQSKIVNIVLESEDCRFDGFDIKHATPFHLRFFQNENRVVWIMDINSNLKRHTVPHDFKMTVYL